MNLQNKCTIFAVNNYTNMIVTFEKEYLQELYDTGKASDKKYRFQPEIVRKYQQRIDMLLGAKGIEVLYCVNSLNYEALSGNRMGVSSIRVNNQYRIEFIVRETIDETVVTVCNILELSNHYK